LLKRFHFGCGHPHSEQPRDCTPRVPDNRPAARPILPVCGWI
jgi:hypothetical protein